MDPKDGGEVPAVLRAGEEQAQGGKVWRAWDRKQAGGTESGAGADGHRGSPAWKTRMEELRGGSEHGGQLWWGRQSVQLLRSHVRHPGPTVRVPKGQQ